MGVKKKQAGRGIAHLVVPRRGIRRTGSRRSRENEYRLACRHPKMANSFLFRRLALDGYGFHRGLMEMEYRKIILRSPTCPVTS